MRIAIFDTRHHVSADRMNLDALEWLKSRGDTARRMLRGIHQTKREDQGLEAMTHWRRPKASECVRHDSRRHILDDNPCSG